MFESIKLRLFVAKVQAELKAQYDDQSFVNRVCQLPENLEHLNVLREQAYFRKDRIAPFLAVCHILDASLNATALPLETRKICAALLGQRLQKASSDPHFRLRHIMIFGHLEENLSEWVMENDTA
jgi:hypothetical protein